MLNGGKVPTDPALAGGFHVEPTIVETAPDSRTTQEEVFGPFMVVHTFSTDEEVPEVAGVGRSVGVAGPEPG